MKKLLILGKAKAVDEIIAYAKSQGVYTILTASENVEQCPAKKLADEAWDISTDQMDLLESKCIENNVSAVFCGISEFNIEIMIELCCRLGLPCYCDKEAWSYSRDKMKFRELCERIGAPMAKRYHVTGEFLRQDLDKVEYPVVVKPVDRNGNRGISFCHNEEELINGYKYALSVSKSEKIVVEKMLTGHEFGAFYAVADGEISLVSMEAMCAQPGYPSNCYSFETTATRELGHFLEELNPKLSEVMKAVGCREGVAWAEFMLDTDGHFYILEMGHRMNGEMTFLAYPKAHGFDVIKWMTDIALGVKHTKEDLPVGLKKCAQTSANVYAFWTKEEATITAINGLNYFRTQPDTYVNLVVQCGDTVEQFRHIGTIIFNSESREMTKRIVHEINTRVTMASTDTENILIQYDHDACIDTI